MQLCILVLNTHAHTEHQQGYNCLEEELLKYEELAVSEKHLDRVMGTNSGPGCEMRKRV